MEVELHSLYWNNGEYLIQSQKKVMDHFEIPVTYHNLDGYPHGKWMNEVLENSKADIVGFIDNDCVPLNREIVQYAVNYAATNKSFIGTAQVSNHIAPYSHIFAAPCFFFICRETWIQLGKPSFSENYRSDVAEEVSYRAEEHKLSYKALYPTFFERESTEGIWKLGNYGYFGIGTVFANGVYHLYQGRYKQNADLFAKRCQEIVDGTFGFDGMRSSF